MSRVSRESAPEVADYGPVEDRTDHFHGYTVNFTTIREDSDLAPMLKGLPGDSCQCPHWGYVTAGRLTVRYADTRRSSSPVKPSTCRRDTCRRRRPAPSS